MQQLTAIRGFLLYILVVSLNAFVDLGHKIVIQNTIFKTWDGQTQIILTAIVNGLILLPFILLFTPSGYLSDRFPKQQVLRYGALAAVAGTVLITLCYLNGWFVAAFVLTLALSIQSAIYSPAKYGYIRELVGDERLAEGNAWVQATTIVSILAGTFLFSVLFERYFIDPLGLAGFGAADEVLRQVAPLGFILVALSLLEWLLALLLPPHHPGDASKRIDLRGYLGGRYLKRNLRTIRASRAIWLSIVGLALFWAISQVMLAAFPAYAKETLAVTNTVLIQGLLAASGIGIVFGSILAGRMSHSYIELGLVPVGAIGVAICLLLLPTLSSATAIGALFMVIGFCGGLFIVPLNALIQYSAPQASLGTVLAGNNWVQNLAMIGFLGLTVLFALLGIDSLGLFLLLALTAIGGALYTIRQLPQSLVRVLASALLKRFYRVRVVGFDHLPKQGGVLLLGNHISWIDWALVQIASPRPVRFVMAREYYQIWYLKPFLKMFGAIPISTGASRSALNEVNTCLKKGELVCLFPEGAISRSGQLGTFHAGYERTVEGVTGATIVPFYLRGLWGSQLSRAGNPKLRENSAAGLKREVIVAFGTPLPLDTRAQQLKQKVFELSISAWEAYTAQLDPLPLAWLKQARSALGSLSLIDSSGAQYSNARVLAGTTLLARAMHGLSPRRLHTLAGLRQELRQDHCQEHAQGEGEQNIGLLLPASAGGVMANLAVMLNGQTAVNLNFTAGAPVVQAAIAKAGIRTVYSSSRFAKKLAGRGIELETMLQGTQVVYLEELMQSLPKWRQLLHLAAAWLLPARLSYALFGHRVDLEQPAQILFSSGSEGTPKGVVLSHRNLMGNIKQISDVLNTRTDDVMLASLPLFHSFGLTVNSLLPMVEGIPALCHPDPTDAFGLGKAVARHRATVLCGTATFLRLYTRNRKVVPQMFESLRVVVAGAEKLTPEVRQGFELKFRKTIYEGYGATETAPVASVNVPDRLDPSNWKLQCGQKPGTVGMPLPGSCFRIVDPDTLAALPSGEEGLILISGGQLMQGYLDDVAKTAEAIIELDGRRWYKSGDKGRLDEDGFLTIVDRYSRFAKIGGEMISLAAVEEAARGLISDEAIECAASHLKDDKKGEQIVLLVTPGIEPGVLRQRLLESGINPLLVPARIGMVEALPKLGSGKLDFAALKRMAQEAIQAEPEAGD